MSVPPVILAIAEEVATERGLTVKQLFGANRRHDIARARFVAWDRIRKEVRFVSGPPSLPQIGTWFGGRDHTTVLNGLRRVQEIDCSAPVRVVVASEEVAA
jgi:chromosomal replication initiator protein